MMQTAQGVRRHSLDIRRTRHPLNGDFLFLMLEYDCTELYKALEDVEAARAELHDIAMKDTLTGVHSLHYMQEVTKTEIAHALRHNQRLSLLFLDLDDFKQINDAFGHDVGDTVLQHVANALQAEIRAEDLVARLGGDEFVVLLSHTHSQDDISQIINRIIARLDQPITLQNTKVIVTASIGIATCPQHGTDLEALVKAADDAMYRVKKAGKHGFVFAE